MNKSCEQKSATLPFPKSGFKNTLTAACDRLNLSGILANNKFFSSQPVERSYLKMPTGKTSKKKSTKSKKTTGATTASKEVVMWLRLPRAMSVAE
jgi:hypothetical protein